ASVSLCSDLYGSVAAADAVALHRHMAREAAMHAVVAQQVRVGFDRTQIVQRDDLDVLAIRLGDCAENVAPDTAKPVGGDAYCHKNAPGFSTRRGRGRPRQTYNHLSALPKLRQRRIGHRFSGNSKFLVQFLVRRARAERLHADKDSVGTANGIPALAYRGFHTDLS